MLEPPKGAVKVLATLAQAGHEGWLVGGCVRDALLGRPVNDWDIATSARPEAVMALFERAIPTGLQHGTVTVVEAGEPIEVTTYRVEGEYTDGRRPNDVAFTSDLTADLARRDFTINAMAHDPLEDRIVDPFDGQGDLERRIIRAVGDPNERFAEDGLRPMRAVRFATVLDLTIEPATWAAIGATLDTFAKVAAERIQIELIKLLRAPLAARGLRQLRDCGLLAGFLPEVAGLPDAPFDRLCRAVEVLTLDTRLAALLRASGLRADALCKRLKLANHTRKALIDLTRPAPDPATLQTPFDLRRFVADIDDLDGWLALQRAWADDPAPWDALAERIAACAAREAPRRPRDLALDGKGIMAATGLRPSRRLGRILEWLLHAVWADPTLNTAEGLTARLPAALAATED